MHFRERDKAIQIIRVGKDSGSKKGKSEIVGRLAKVNPQVSAELEAALTAAERKEVAAWIAAYANLDRLKKEVAVRTLPEQLAIAESWFKDHKDDAARALAASLFQSWVQLRVVLKRNGLVD
jgi:hypothetical protein